MSGAEIAPRKQKTVVLAAVLENPDAEFDRQDVLGEGTYGVVYRAVRRRDAQPVALKLMRRNGRAPPAAALREAALLRCLPPHPNVVRLENIFRSPGAVASQLWLAFELCDGDLRNLLRASASRCIPLPQAKTFARELLRGLAHCHAHGVLHRDIKPQNLLIKEGRLLLADFGLARSQAPPCHRNTQQVVTLWYRAPELLLGEPCYTSAVDMWAAGCVIAEMMSGRPLFPGASEIDTLLRIFRLFGTPAEPNDPLRAHNAAWAGVTQLPLWNNLFPNWFGKSAKQALTNIFSSEMSSLEASAAAEFVAQLLALVPRQRPSAATALAAPWLSTSTV